MKGDWLLQLELRTRQLQRDARFDLKHASSEGMLARPSGRSPVGMLAQAMLGIIHNWVEKQHFKHLFFIP